MGDNVNVFSPDRNGEDDDNEGTLTGINKHKIIDVQLNHKAILSRLVPSLLCRTGGIKGPC